MTASIIRMWQLFPDFFRTTLYAGQHAANCRTKMPALVEHLVNQFAVNQIKVREIVSGGQTGVDRAGLDAAIFLNLDHGGWCPQGRVAEDGRIPGQYALQETRSSKYPVRTEQNVIDSDGTLILYFQLMAGGTKLTKSLARKHRRACLCLDLADEIDPVVVRKWLTEHGIVKLNVAGPRESTVPGIGDLAREFLVKALGDDGLNDAKT